MQVQSRLLPPVLSSLGFTPGIWTGIPQDHSTEWFEMQTMLRCSQTIQATHNYRHEQLSNCRLAVECLATKIV